MVAKRILYKRIKWSCDQFPTSENPPCRGPYLLPAHSNLLQFNTVIAKSMFEAMTSLSGHTLPVRYQFASADRGEPGTFTGETTFPPWSSLCSLVAKNELSEEGMNHRERIRVILGCGPMVRIFYICLCKLLQICGHTSRTS